ncbi:hypothetical protein [Homoserinibacter gongjuensis]|uniref:BON domain-containing protein n=1 Tax=Homoserinibacter gongjuensis TaxID=1162968 RepID=A0ABQ6JVE3_9MICO|nr:hypothetical protein [Homoserinibacter gongjuensis]GMA91979.1 hypothetical protein GCM10025869_25080 [Homoserinibacter gongjuensis]
MHLTIEPTTITELDVERVLDDVYRVRERGRVLGYILETGSMYVTLRGEIFNTSLEVGQSHDLDTAVRVLAER